MELKNIIIEKKELIKIIWFILKERSKKNLTKNKYTANKKNDDNLSKWIIADLKRKEYVMRNRNITINYNYSKLFQDIEDAINEFFLNCEIIYIISSKNKNTNNEFFEDKKEFLKIYSQVFNTIKNTFHIILKNPNLFCEKKINGKIKTNIKKIVEDSKKDDLKVLDFNEFKKFS